MSDDNIKKLPVDWNVQAGDIEVVVKKVKHEENLPVQMTPEFWDAVAQNCCDLLNVWNKANPGKVVVFGMMDNGRPGYKVVDAAKFEDEGE